MDISGSKVLLTGATGGLGQAIARALAGKGAQLILTGRRLDVLEPLAGELGARALAVDLSEAAEVDRLLSEAGELDILVANAALPGSGKLDSLSMEQIDRALEVNLRAPIAMAHALVPEMVARGRGHLLFMSSLSGKAATAGSSIYNATKFGLRGFAGAMRAELHGSGVGVSTVFPGFIREAGMFADAKVQLPKGVGTRSPEDVAKAVVGAIEHNRGEVDVAPIALRLGSAFAGIAPELSATFTRKSGSDKIALDLADGHRAKQKL
ncbi:MAG TPA: SDR family NAD(P)-dependent oxidoreductase [Solirubrobacteraceae bacterium]|jgi:short-subunit dehydrogenase|nr:SDR family NAD(P)-dependent oxidoreductase [Solirubrobacteraceae bacterium]